MRRAIPKLSQAAAALDPLDAALATLAPLHAADLEIARQLLSGQIRQYPARRDILREDDRPHSLYLLLEGWASRYKMLADGRRQFVGLLLPGDLFDYGGFTLRRMGHGIGAVTAVTAAQIGPNEVARLIALPGIADSLWRNELIALSVQREWTLSVGSRTALERVAHLLCEIFFRLRAIGLIEGDGCDCFPLTQNDIAETCGLTAVHVNRMVQMLRADRLIRWRDKRLSVPDLPRLMKAGLFSPDYLHLGQPDDDD